MAGYYSVWRFSRTTLAILLATAWMRRSRRAIHLYSRHRQHWALGLPVELDGRCFQYNFSQRTRATALINSPIWTGTTNYNLFLPAGDITVGELKIDNTNFANTYRTNFANGGAYNYRLVFQSTSGPAKYTETRGTSPGPANTQTDFKGGILVNSDLIINQDNYPNLNTGTIFEQPIEGAADKTIYKEGHGGIQFNYTAFTGPPFNETPFQGKFVIDQGGVRLLTPSPFSNVSGVTVNSGGQLMLADNANNVTNANWDLAVRRSA